MVSLQIKDQPWANEKITTNKEHPGTPRIPNRPQLSREHIQALQYPAVPGEDTTGIILLIMYSTENLKDKISAYHATVILALPNK